MDILQIANIVLVVIGGATVVLRIVAPMTKTKKDDRVLAFIEKALGALSLDSKFFDKKFKDKMLSIRLKR